jgi:hypothetical protein
MGGGFSGFGRDPFANDPFFADAGFGRIDKIMGDMRKQMKEAMMMDANDHK